MSGTIHYLVPQGEERREIVRFKPYWASEMQDVTTPRREWLIDGVLQRGSVILFAGAAKIGKSLLLQQLLTAVSLGQPFLDRETIATRAFGMFSEDPQHEIQLRQEDFNSFYDRQPGDFENDLSWLSLDGVPQATLVDFDRYATKPKLTDLWHQLWAHVADNDVQIVGLDNARVLFGGIDSFPNQVVLFIRLLVQKAIEINGAIILCVHPPKGDPDGFAGTGAWHSAVRGGMSLRRPRGWDIERDGMRDGRRLLSGLGSNYGAGIGSEQLEIQEGVFIRVDDHGYPRARRKANAPLTDQAMNDLRYRMLAGVKKVLKNGGFIMADEEHKSSMSHRAKRSTDPEVSRITLNELNRAQDLMLEAGQLLRVSVKGKCVLRPADGPYYENEEPWLPQARPGTTEIKNAAD